MGVSCSCEENKRRKQKEKTNEVSNDNKANKPKKNIDTYNDEDLQSIDEFGKNSLQNDNIAEYLPEDDDQKIDSKNKNIPKVTNFKSKINLENLYESYYAAKEYFRLNGLREQEVDAINKCRNLKKLKENPKLNNIEIPDEITPEYIYGYSKQKKISKCKEIEKSLIDQKEYINKNMQEYIESLKKLNKKKFESVKTEAKTKLDNDKLEIEKLDKCIKIINDIEKNEWVPVPEYLKIDKEKKIEIIQEDIPEKTMRINVGHTTYTKSNAILKLEIEFDKKNCNKIKEIKCKENNDFSESFEWKFDNDQWNNLYKNKINIILERSYNIKKNKIKGIGKIDLRKLKNEFHIEGDFKLEMKSQKESKIVGISIDIRHPFLEKKYDIISKEIIEIKKIFPAFESKIYANDNEENVAKRELNKSQLNETLSEINGVLNTGKNIK